MAPALFMAPGSSSMAPHIALHARSVWVLTEQRLAGADWAVGGRYSTVDIHLVRLYRRFRPAAQPGAAETALGYELPA